MNNIRKIAAGAVAALLAAGTFGCASPAIGSGSRTALTVDGYDVNAGIFIYYTMQAYSEAVTELTGEDGTAPDLETVKSSKIGDVDSEDWIQDKATEYCRDYVSLLKEFEAIGGELSAEDKDQAASMAEYYYNSDSRNETNGISLDSMKKVAESTYIEQEIFKHYYGFDSEYGCSEDELKDYFEENFARVKYFSISLTDSAGEPLTADEVRQRKKMAEDYVKQINAKSGELEKMQEVDVASDDYDEFLTAQTTTAEDGSVETTTTTAATTTAEGETTTTTTTDPYANERLLQKNTTTSADEAAENTETEAAEEETDAQKQQNAFNDYVFNELGIGEAKVYEYSDDMIYVVIRGDLRERMTEDDYWSEDYISQLQQLKYYDEFIKLLEKKAENLEIDKNSSAYRRYSPFKLVLETES